MWRCGPVAGLERRREYGTQSHVPGAWTAPAFWEGFWRGEGDGAQQQNDWASLTNDEVADEWCRQKPATRTGVPKEGTPAPVPAQGFPLDSWPVMVFAGVQLH